MKDRPLPDKNGKSVGKISWRGMPVWAFIGVMVVLAPLFVFMTLENIQRQKKNSDRLLAEKGAALIRSFEAGTRTGMMGGWAGFQLQRLLVETARQPDIEYLIVTDKNGIALAHSDPGKIGTAHVNTGDATVSVPGEELQWRRIQTGEGKAVFEVFRRFKPIGIRSERFRERIKRHRLLSNEGDKQPRHEPPKLVAIYVGLDPSSVESALKADTRQTVLLATFMLLLGMAGVILLFVFQGYRSTRASLFRIKAFSDTLVDHLPLGLVATDGAGRVISFNHAAEIVFGIEAGKALGLDADEIFPVSIQPVLSQMKSERSSIEKEISLRRFDGTSLPVEITVSRLRNESGELSGHVILIKDMTEVRFLRNEVTRNQRMATVGRLAAGVAHEVRNPLSSIKGFATYFKERYQDAPEDQQIVGIMIQEIDRINRVIGQLLEFSRPVAVEKRPVDLKALLEESMKQIERQAESRGIKLDLVTMGNLQSVGVDRDRMRQVFLNLFLNAIDAMEEGGVLTVKAIADEKRGNVEIGITDSGIGISAEGLEQVFDPYYTTKPTGTGLGLAIVHNIMEAHGGTIQLESTQGQGTTVTMALGMNGGE